MKALLARLIAARKNRLPLGRCACLEPSVKWCTRHGRPLKLKAVYSPACRTRHLFSGLAGQKKRADQLCT